MANIKINDIKPAGAELFTDSEGFLNEINEHELNNVLGGFLDNWHSGFSWHC